MIDKETFKRINPNYPVTEVKGNVSGIVAPVSDMDESDVEEGTPRSATDNPDAYILDTLSDDDLLLASPILYGFSLSDKLWLEFDVEQVSTFEWNDRAFQQLVLPAKQKDLIQSLVESHSQGAADFDDFIKGKGRGLIIK
jgi:hypothetical protein